MRRGDYLLFVWSVCYPVFALDRWRVPVRRLSLPMSSHVCRCIERCMIAFCNICFHLFDLIPLPILQRPIRLVQVAESVNRPDWQLADRLWNGFSDRYCRYHLLQKLWRRCPLPVMRGKQCGWRESVCVWQDDDRVIPDWVCLPIIRPGHPERWCWLRSKRAFPSLFPVRGCIAVPCFGGRWSRNREHNWYKLYRPVEWWSGCWACSSVRTASPMSGFGD